MFKLNSGKLAMSCKELTKPHKKFKDTEASMWNIRLVAIIVATDERIT